MRVIASLAFALALGWPVLGLAQDAAGEPGPVAAPIETTAPPETTLPAQAAAPPATTEAADPYDENELLYDALSARITEKLLTRQDTLFQLLGGGGAALIAILGFLGLGRLQDLRRSIREEIRQELASSSTFQESVASQIQQRLLSELSAQADTLRGDMQLVRLQVLLERIKAGGELDDNDRALLREGLFGLIKRPEVVNGPVYRIALELGVRDFFQRGRSAEFDQLDDEIGDVIRGQKENLDPMVRMMQRWRYFEYAAHYLLAHEVQTQGRDWEKRVASLWQDVGYFTDGEKAAMYDNIDYCSRLERMSPNPGPVHYRMADAFKAVTQRYPNEMATLERAFVAITERSAAQAQAAAG